MFLAWPFGQSHAAFQRGVLGAQDKPQPPEGRMQQGGLEKDGVEGHDYLGMPVEAVSPQADPS